VASIARRGDLQQRADRLDPEGIPVLVDELPQDVSRRSSSAWAVHHGNPGRFNLARTSAIINVCQALGVQFALDDFGTGSSSLAYLKRLPVNPLKIDRSLIRAMLDDPDDLVIVESVLGLSAAFRRLVIAEGVETMEHGERLLRLGCEHGQGFGTAHPMPAQALPTCLSVWRPHPRWLAASVANRKSLTVRQTRPWFATAPSSLRAMSRWLTTSRRLSSIMTRIGWAQLSSRPREQHHAEYAAPLVRTRRVFSDRPNARMVLLHEH
jgi:hypothetical protein